MQPVVSLRSGEFSAEKSTVTCNQLSAFSGGSPIASCFLKLFGENPVSFLKVLQKKDEEEKPERRAMILIGRLGKFVRRFFAVLIRD